MTKKISQADLVLSYFKSRPGEIIREADAVDWLVAEWMKLTGKVFRDANRAIRKQEQKRVLIRVKKGVFKYDPDHVLRDDLYDFTPQQKKEVLQKDNYRCVVCGLGITEGIDLQVDHIISKDRGGKNTIENGETLCGPHNFIKKNYSQKEAGKRFFIKMREQAVLLDDKQMLDFCDAILDTYSQFGYDEQIKV